MADNKSPILNNPYDEPQWHYDATPDGNLDYSKILQGRRPYAANLTVMPNTNLQSALFSNDDMPNDDLNAPFINGIRAVVKEWRETGWPKVTRTTRDLLTYWFENPERELHKSLFFCQREAIETAIYLNEVAPRDPNLGRSLLHELDQRRQSVSDLYEDVLPRTAFKMATGTGKTVVMAMLILYHYIRKKIRKTHVLPTIFSLLHRASLSVTASACFTLMIQASKNTTNLTTITNANLSLPNMLVYLVD